MILPVAIQNLAAPFPLPWVERVAQVALDRVLLRHPRIFDRLGNFAERAFCFAPQDLPFEFVVQPRARKVTVFSRRRSLRHHVRVSGPMAMLLALAEGRLDGDAKFFGRQLAIEGDMEAMLALRNAVENESLDFVKDLAPSNRLLRGPVKAILGRAREVLLKSEETH